MVLSLQDARLDTLEPGEASVNQQVPGDDIQELTVARRGRDLVDSGTIIVNNDDTHPYTGAIETGDQVQFYVQDQTQTSLARRWTGMVRNVSYDRAGPAVQNLTLEVDDWVFALLDHRNVENVFRDTQIAGTADAILNTILATNAPEIDRSGIASVSQTTSVLWDGASLLEATKELADRANAWVWQDHETIHFEPVSARPTKFALADSDVDRPRVRVNDDQLYNRIRVRGGTGTEQDDAQTTQSSTTTVTESSRITHQLSTRKSEVAKIEVYTQTTGSNEAVVVRLQDDDGGAPVDVTDLTSDLARKELAHDFLDPDGFTTFAMPDHTLAPNADPWLIIETDGSTGQDIGTDGSGNPTYKSYYPYPVESIVADQASIDAHGQRDQTVDRRSLVEREQTRDVATALLERRSEPSKELSFGAESERVHDLTPGEVVGASFPDENLDDDVIVLEVGDEYDGSDLATTIRAQAVSTI